MLSRTSFHNEICIAIAHSSNCMLSTRKYGDWITCAWIRRVEGANNTDARFAAAFSGIPANKFRIYTDADIAGLANINVAGGEC